MFKLGKYIKKYKWPVFLGPLFKALETAADIITPFLMAMVIDVGIASGDSVYILKMCGIIVLIAIFSFCFTVVCQKCSAVAQAGICKDIRKDMFCFYIFKLLKRIFICYELCKIRYIIIICRHSIIAFFVSVVFRYTFNLIDKTVVNIILCHIKTLLSIHRI